MKLHHHYQRHSLHPSSLSNAPRFSLKQCSHYEQQRLSFVSGKTFWFGDEKQYLVVKHSVKMLMENFTKIYWSTNQNTYHNRQTYSSNYTRILIKIHCDTYKRILWTSSKYTVILINVFLKDFQSMLKNCNMVSSWFSMFT